MLCSGATKRESAAARKKQATVSADHTPCYICHVEYGDPTDVRKHEIWMTCESCHIWVHHSCGLDYGIDDDDGTYHCMRCIA